MGIFGSLGGAMGLGAFARGGSAITGYGGGRRLPPQPAMWPEMPPETGPPPGMDPAAWQQGEDYLNRINPGRMGGNTGVFGNPAEVAASRGQAPPMFEPGPALQGPPVQTSPGWGDPSAVPQGLPAPMPAPQMPASPPMTGLSSGMLPLGFYGQGPAGWGSYGGWGGYGGYGGYAPARASTGQMFGNRAGSSYAPMSTGRLMGARY